MRARVTVRVRNAALQAKLYYPLCRRAARAVCQRFVRRRGYRTRDVVARLVKHRCRLLQRGIQAEAYSAGQAGRSKWQQCQGWLPKRAAGW